MILVYKMIYEDGTELSKEFDNNIVRFNEDKSLNFYHSLKILNLDPITTPNLLSDFIKEDKNIVSVEIAINNNTFYKTENPIINTFYKNGFSESGDLFEYILFDF